MGPYLHKHDHAFPQNLIKRHFVIIITLEDFIFQELARCQMECFSRSVEPAAIEPRLPCTEKTNYSLEAKHRLNETHYLVFRHANTPPANTLIFTSTSTEAEGDWLDMTTLEKYYLLYPPTAVQSRRCVAAVLTPRAQHRQSHPRDRCCFQSCSLGRTLAHSRTLPDTALFVESQADWFLCVEKNKNKKNQ